MTADQALSKCTFSVGERADIIIGDCFTCIAIYENKQHFFFSAHTPAINSIIYIKDFSFKIKDIKHSIYKNKYLVPVFYLEKV